MTPEKHDKMYALCILIQNEKDPRKFNSLVEELDRLLNAKRERIQASERQSQGSVGISRPRPLDAALDDPLHRRLSHESRKMSSPRLDES